MTRVRPAGTTLLIPVPAASVIVDDQEAASSDDRELPPHVTVLWPFMPPHAVDAEVKASLAELVGAFPRFPFRLERIERFAGGTVYAVPEPAEPFVALTRAIWRRWPDHAPYRGAFPAIVPHLTVPSDGEQRAAMSLPVETEATEVLLYGANRRGRWRLIADFPLMEEP